MPKIEQYVCDSCGAVKQTANHWFRVVTIADTLHLFTWSAPARVVDEDGCSHTPSWFYLCGDSCVTKKVAEFMTELKRKQDESATTDGGI